VAYSGEVAKIQIPEFAELYTILTNNTTYRYTSSNLDVVTGGYTYLARPIKRSEFSFADRLRTVKTTISAPLDAPFLQYIANSPPELTDVTIVRRFQTTGTYSQIFKGKVISITIEKNIATCECESETRLLKNKVPALVFQAYCNNMLFDSVCGVAKATYKVETTVTVSGSTLSAAAFDALADGHFICGFVEYGNDVRLITNHVGAVLTLQIPFANLTTGGTVKAYPGCDKSYETCLAKFNNLAQRLAFDNIPSSNPCIFGFKS